MHVLAKISLGPLIDHSKSIEGSPSSKLGTKNITPSKYFFFAIPYCYEPIRPLRRYQGTYVNISRFSFSIKRPSCRKSSFFRVLPWQSLKGITEEDYELWKKYLFTVNFWKMSLFRALGNTFINCTFQKQLAKSVLFFNLFCTFLDILHPS